MRGSRPAVYLACLLTATHTSNGATIQDRMMRNEKASSEKALQLMPNGMMETEALIGKEDPYEFCNDDFPWGIANSNICDSRSITHMSDLDQDQCIFAAEKAGAQTHASDFDVDQTWQNVRPIGCFMFPCGSNTCYYHNEDGDTPHGNLTGVPVCRRRMYKEGTAFAGAFSNDDRICGDSDYSAAIITEAKCRKVASCLGHTQGADFTIGSHTKSDELLYPQGCFIHAAERTAEGKEVVYFNPSTMGQAPTHPEGKPLCKVIHPQQVRTHANNSWQNSF